MSDSLTFAFIGYGEVGKLVRPPVSRGRRALRSPPTTSCSTAPTSAPPSARKPKPPACAPRSTAADAAKDARCDLLRRHRRRHARRRETRSETYAAPGQFFVDVNSASPETKTRRAREIDGGGRALHRGRRHGAGRAEGNCDAHSRRRPAGGSRGCAI